MRLFIAIDFPTPIKNKLSASLEKFKPYIKYGNYSHEENLHLTLKFLGETDPSKIFSIKDAISLAAEGVKGFDMILQKTGAFPSGSKKTVWIGVTAPEDLISLTRKLDDCLSVYGFIRESRPYTPHVTLIREAILDSASELTQLSMGPFPFHVDGVTLFESKRINGRLSYLPLYVKNLSD